MIFRATVGDAVRIKMKDTVTSILARASPRNVLALRLKNYITQAIALGTSERERERQRERETERERERERERTYNKRPNKPWF